MSFRLGWSLLIGVGIQSVRDIKVTMYPGKIPSAIDPFFQINHFFPIGGLYKPKSNSCMS